MRLMICLVMALGLGTCRAEVGCFRTPAQAAVQVGEQEGGGYRLEFVRRDAIGGRSWAKVRSCVHPEWPAVVVRAVAETQLKDGKAVVDLGHPAGSVPVVMGGKRVRVVMSDAVVRMETTGVVQGSGQVGDRVWVRIMGPGDDGNGRLELAVVRSADVLEVGQ